MAPNQDMRGLTQYIADLRACRVRELEEKRVNKEMAHIRQKFKDGNLDGYQRKKYISKIVFTYILGYQVDTGHMEAVNLIASSKYSEKQIGYLALTLLMHENSDLVRLVTNSIRKDLDSMDEACNCLALHAIANIGGKEMAEALTIDVHRLLISPTSKSFVKKKAALTLLRLYRKYPECVDPKEWGLRIVSLMDDQNLGVALAVTSLVLSMAQDNLDEMAVSYQKAVDRMNKIVVQGEFSSDYVYYRVPVPWLQVKLLRLLQYYPPSDDPTIRIVLHNILKTILEKSKDTPKNVQHNNAQNAVLFEAISLAIHLDTESKIVASAANLLGKFILSKETNVRYLGLDTMAHLAARSDSLEAVKKHQDTVILLFKDRDVSVRRRALDLLYSMCDGSNAKTIVGELLKYLAIADYTLREEMVLKIAILTEKFATEYEWYVDTILRLMSQAGDYVGEEVWYRIVQIVTNTEELQEYAARRVYEHLRNPACHENIIKVAGYILGEFGHLIAEEDDDASVSPLEQFSMLNSKIPLCSPSTKALILTTYIKWLNLFPEIREPILAILQKFTHTLDAELQQRACEYLAIASMPEEEILQVVVDEMPPFPEQRESALLSRLMKKHGEGTGDKRTWVAGGKDVNKDKDEERYRGFGVNRRKALPASDRAGQANGEDAVKAAAEAIRHTDTDLLINGVGHNNLGISIGMNGSNGEYVPPDDIMAGLAGLDMSGSNNGSLMPLETPPMQPLQPSLLRNDSITAEAAGASGATSQAEAPLLNSMQSTSSLHTLSTQAPSSSAASTPMATPSVTPAASSAPVASSSASTPALPQIQFTHGAEKHLGRLAYNNEGVLYEDAQLQVGLKSEFHGHQGRIALYFGNKISAPFTSFTVTVESQEPDALSVSLPKMPSSTLGATTQVQQVVQVECKAHFTAFPVLKISYLAGSHQTVTLRLPVWQSKFIDSVVFSGPDFFERWKQIGGPPREAQVIFPIKMTSAGGVDVSRNKKVIKGLKFGILEGIDPNPNNIVGAGVLHTAVGKTGCLLRLEPNPEAKLCRLTIRTTNEQISAQLLKIVQEPLKAK